MRTDTRIITEPLGGSALSRAIQAGHTPTAWVAPRPAGIEGWRQHAQQRAGEKDWAAVWARLAPAIQSTGAADERLRRVIAAGGVVVTTGQQPGLFGGPIYTLSKAVSALAFADALEAATGVPTVAVFWAATDDADFAEASSVAVARRGGLDVLRSVDAPPPGTPMSLAPLGDLRDQVERLAAACGSTADVRALDFVRDAYAAGSRATVGGAFVQLMRSLLEPLGMPVLDASHEAVAAASAPVLSRALGSAGDVERALASRSAEVRSGGFQPQVEDVKGLALVFAREGRIKRRLAVGEAAPNAVPLSPNVLLRPIVEREILPTVAYMAGPGELAYFAQVSVVAHTLQLGVPLALPRWSCTVIEPEIQRLLDRLGTSIEELSDPAALESRLARTALDEDARNALARFRASLAALPESLATTAEALDLERAVQGAAGAMLHRADRLERRLLSAVKRRETALMTDAATLRAALRPRGELQERMLNPVPMLTRQGLSLLEDMKAVAVPHAESMLSARAS